jgi:hypothetical protein
LSSRNFLVGLVLCVSLAVGQEALALPVGLAPGFQIAGTTPYLEVDLLGSPLSGQTAPPSVDGPLLLGISLWTAALLLLRAQGQSNTRRPSPLWSPRGPRTRAVRQGQ